VKASWVAGTVRARSLADRCLGRERAHDVASCATLADAVARLAGTPYGARMRAAMGLAEAQRSLAETALWHLRVLGGWLPPGGAPRVRSLAAWFELANVDARLAELTGLPSGQPFALGTLGSAARSIAGASSTTGLRASLAASPWGDPGSDDAAEIARALRLAWARRLLADAPEARAWALGGIALLLARDLAFGRRLTGLPGALPSGLATRVEGAADIAELARQLPDDAAWALADIHAPEQLWIAEWRWWQRVEQDAWRLVRGGAGGPPVVTGTAALLAVDAHRIAAALATAAHGGTNAALEMFDASA
jgi:hypothetical protein